MVLRNKKQFLKYMSYCTVGIWILAILVELFTWDKWASSLVTSDISAFVENLLLAIVIIPIFAIVSPIGWVALALLVLLVLFAARYNNPSDN